MRKLYTTLSLVLSVFFADAQKTISVSGCIDGLNAGKVYLKGFTLGKQTYSDSAAVSNHCISFSVPDSLRGLFHVIIDEQNKTFFPLLIDGNEIKFHTSVLSLLEGMTFSESVQNKLYYQSLQDIKAGKKHSGHGLADAFVNMQIPVALPSSFTGNANTFFRDHFLDNVDFNKAELLYSDLLIPKIFSYLQYFESNDYTFNEQGDNLAVAFDRLLFRAKDNIEMYNTLRTKFNDRFRYGNYDIIGAYLSKYYKGFPPEKMYAAEDVRKRIDSLQHPTLGQKIPDIEMTNYDGSKTKLYDLKSDYTLLVFWSSFCYHCTQTLPKLKKIYDTRKPGLEILAVSFDTDKDQWQNFIRKNDLGWINYSDLKGWDSPIAKDYDIQGTPTFILVSSDKTIISKPLELEDLVAELQSLKLM